MDVTCSEQLKTALIKADGDNKVVPIHAINASWPMERCPVKVILAEERPLTILEKFTLRAFRDVEGVTAKEIAENLGLGQPLLIEQTLERLRNSGAIEVNLSQEEENSPLAELERQLRLKQDDRELLGNDKAHLRARGRLSHANELDRSIKTIRSKIATLKEGSEKGGKTWLSRRLEALKRFKAALTDVGKENLLEGKITLPQETVNLELTRAAPTWEPMTPKGYSNSDFEASRNRKRPWPPIEDSSSDREVTIDEAEKALIKGANQKGKITIQKIERIAVSPCFLILSIVLCVRIEDNSCIVRVYNGTPNSTYTGSRLSWIEEYINNDAITLGRIISRFEKQMPKASGAEVDSIDVVPLTRLTEHLIEEVESQNRSPVIVRNMDQLTAANKEAKDQWEKLLERNRIVLSKGTDKVERIPTTWDESIFHYKVSRKDPPIPASGSIALSRSLISRAKIRLQINKSSQENTETVELPVLQIDQDAGEPIIQESVDWLRGELPPEDNFKFTNNKSDLIIWINQIVSKITEIGLVFSEFKKIDNSVKYGKYDVYSLFFERLLLRQDKHFGEALMPNGPFELYKELTARFSIHQGFDRTALWRIFEPKIQQHVMREAINSKGTRFANLERWQSHNSNSNELPWEDAASLENSLFTHCNSTFFQVNIQIEQICTTLTEENGLYGEDHWRKLLSLRDAEVIDKGLWELCDLLRRERNPFTHGFTKSVLPNTLSAIGAVRKLNKLLANPLEDSKLSKPEGGFELGNISVDELTEYIKHASEILRNLPKLEVETKGNPEIWLSGLRTILPDELPELPMEIVTMISKDCQDLLNGPMQFADISSLLLRKAESNWVELLEDIDAPLFSEEFMQTMDDLRDIGCVDDAKNLYNLAAKKYPPKNLEELISECEKQEELLEFTNEPDLKARWKKAASKIELEIEDLGNIPDTVLKNMGQANNILMKTAITSKISSVNHGDVDAILWVFDSLRELIDANPRWAINISVNEGYLASRTDAKIRGWAKYGDKVKMQELQDSLKGKLPDQSTFPKSHAKLEQIVNSRKGGRKS